MTSPCSSRLGVSQQLQATPEHGDADGQLGAGVVKARPSFAALGVNLGKPRLDLVLRQGADDCQVEEPFLLLVEVGNLLGQVAIELSSRCLFFVDHLAQLRLHVIEEVFGQRQPGVVVDDGSLDDGDGQILQIALLLLPSPAEEVAMQITVPAASLGVDEPVVSPSGEAPIAEELALQVVQMDTVAAPPLTAGRQDLLRLLEGRLAD